MRFEDPQDYESAWQRRAPVHDSIVHLVVARPRPGVHETPPSVSLDPTEGVIGDRWKIEDGDPDTQVTMMMTDVASLLCGEELPHHLPGDNLVVGLELSEEAVPVGTKFGIGDCVLQVSPAIHSGCASFSERFGSAALRWVNAKANRGRRLRGLKCRILSPGVISVGDRIERLA